MTVAIITGASSGMGREFVRQFSEYVSVDEVWVIARRASALEELSAECAVPVRPIPLDLCDDSAFATFAALLEKEQPDVKLLVNAAGFGKFGALDVTEDWDDEARRYFIGIVGFFFYNMLSGVLRGLGDSVSALGFLLLAAALNVVLDLLFVAGFDMGVAGVSLATVIAQTISALFCFRKLMKMRAIFDLNKQTVKLDQAVAIDEVKRFIADREIEASKRFIPRKLWDHDKKIAVIGSGPAGISRLSSKLPRGT